MASDHLEKLWQSIIPLSQIPKARKEPAIDAQNASLPPLAAVDPIGTTSRIQQDVALKAIDRLTERINTLLEAVADAKLQVLTTSGKMSVVMDQTLESTTALVNRSQQRILTAVGQPAQQGVTQGLLESYKAMVGIVEMMEKMSSIQANQNNLQATLLTIMSQAQQTSAQLISVEKNLLQRMDDFRKETGELLKNNRKRTHDGDLPTIYKRRKLTESSWVNVPAHGPGVMEAGTSGVMLEGEVHVRHFSSRLSPPTTSSQTSSSVSCRDELDHQVNMHPTIGSVSGNIATADGRSTKAQKLASFFGATESYEESCTDDLFSRLEDGVL